MGVLGKTFRSGRGAWWLKSTYFGHWRFTMQIHKLLARNDPEKNTQPNPIYSERHCCKYSHSGYFISKKKSNIFLREMFWNTFCGAHDFPEWKNDMGMTSEISHKLKWLKRWNKNSWRVGASLSRGPKTVYRLSALFKGPISDLVDTHWTESQ